MRKKFDKEKLLIIGILPLMWFVYFLFELFCTNIQYVSVSPTFILCISFDLIFFYATYFLLLLTIPTLILLVEEYEIFNVTY